MQDVVYLDHNATTPLDRRVRDAMVPWLDEVACGANPSSIHRPGQRAHGAVEQAREEVAALIGARRLEIVFTSSGTEANNTVLLARARHAAARGEGPGHLVISALEHPSVTAAAERLAETGVEVERVAPEANGVVDPERFLAALRDDTFLACLMLANNEIGTVQPVAEVAAGCRERGVPVLADAVQAIGKMPVDVGELGVSYLTLGAHKFNGPLGAAALWMERGAAIEPLMLGGSQERRLRAGTENVPAIVGMGEASRLVHRELDQRVEHLAGLGRRFEAGLAAIPGTTIHCADAPRLVQTTHVAFDGVEGEALLIRLDLAGYAVSTGSACSSGAVHASPALLALGLSQQEALSSLRVSFGPSNDADQVDRFLAVLEREVEDLRRLAPGRLERAVS